MEDPSLSILNIESACGSGETSKSQRCPKPTSSRASRTCMTCPHFKPTDLFASTQTHRTYPILNHEDKPIDCNSVNLIYLMTCSTCHLQYVGETCTPLKDRWAKHRSGMRGSPYHQDCPKMLDHFSKGLCKGSHFSLQIIEKLKGDGRVEDKEEKEEKDDKKKKTKRAPMDTGVGVERRKRETFWIRTLRTAYPYGLNDRIGDEYKRVDRDTEAIGKHFLKTDRKINKSLDCRHARNSKCKLFLIS